MGKPTVKCNLKLEFKVQDEDRDDVIVTPLSATGAPLESYVTTGKMAPASQRSNVVPFTPKGASTKSTQPKCHHSHPGLPILCSDGITRLVYGGSCLDPVIKDMDIFIGLDGGMQHTKRRYPWEPGLEYLFPIPDMGVPPDLSLFKSLIQYLSEQIMLDKKIFIGCIGGHGRTGLVLSVLVQSIAQEADAVTYVREHYCKKVVESSVQVEWLNKNFGITKVSASKTGHTAASLSATVGYKSSLESYSSSAYLPSNNSPKKEVHPVSSKGCIWTGNTLK